MNPLRRGLLASAAMAATMPASLPLRAQVRVQIAGVGATQLPLALAPLRDEGTSGVPLSAIVKADLERSGLFRVSPADASLDERSSPEAAMQAGRGNDALAAGTVTKLVDGRFDIRYKLWDAAKGEVLLDRRTAVLPADLRLAAHRIADEIHQRMTGERGANATRIAYVVKNGRRYTLWVADADGEGGQAALASPEPIISPAWSPDGRRLAYVSFETQKAAVWMQDLLTGERKVIASFRGSNSAPAFSPDGTRLAVALSQDGPTQLYTMPSAGGTPQRLTSSNGIDTEPVYSPDGRFIYFVSDRGGGPQVYRVGAGGGNAERVTFSGAYNISPSISPDGKQLAYIARQGNAYQLALQDLDSGTSSVISDTQDDESPSFAPNGRLIVFATRTTGGDVLMTTTLDGKIRVPLVRVSGGADMREPAWGPFGR